MNEVKLHGVLTASPEKVFRALIDPDALAAWWNPTSRMAMSSEQPSGSLRIRP
ncbi:MAG: SRPBCC domain-containing protein [Saprospiraceae bacterium]|nr:SRPBCC domain-containing protein [Saprospiraceae bacterium]MBP9211102.1 SRPBCC domain-containing protein [Saprospiraceae bacterium]